MGALRPSSWSWKKNNGNPQGLLNMEEFRSFSNLQRELDNIFENFFSDYDLAKLNEIEVPSLELKQLPKVDIIEKDKIYLITAEMPGVEEKDIEVTLADNILTLKSERESKKEEKSEKFHRMECSYGSYQRSLPLPENADDKKVEASYKNGILTVEVAKKAGATKSKAKKIEVKKA